jgi:hypothetical protein
MVFKKGQIPWNRGLTAETDEKLRKSHQRLSETMKNKYKNGQLVPWNKGIKGIKRPEHSIILKKLFAEGKMTPWNKGKTKETNDSIRKVSDSLKEFHKRNPDFHRGRKHTEETKLKLSKMRMGKNNPMYGKSAWNRGKKMSPENFQKLMEGKRKYKYTDEVRKKMSKGMKKAIREGRRVYIVTQETREKMRKSAKGQHRSPETEFKKGKNSLENHTQWKGGISFEPYGVEFNKELKTKIRKKFKFICQICNKNGYDVHHIDYNKRNNSEENLTNICRKCHAKVNFNRDYWINYFLTISSSSMGKRLWLDESSSKRNV